MKNSIKLFTLLGLLGILALFVFVNTNSNASQAQEFGAVTSVKASHILVDTKAQADMIKTKINNGESFESLAKQYSKCPSGENGGDLGYFERGQMVKEFEDVAFALPIGKVSNPVQTQFGWHLIKVYAKR